MRTLLKFEIRKIVKKKSTIIAFVFLLALQAFLAFAGSIGTTYVDDEFLETHMERNKIDRANGIELSGRVIDDALLSEMKEAYAKVDWEDNRYRFSSAYQEEARKYAGLDERIRMWGLKKALMGGTLTENMLYESRKADMKSTWEYYELNEKEQAYWQAREAEVEKPFTYQYSTAYEYLAGMHGGYMICLIFTFFISIAMVNVFGEEHSRKTDQLILCSRYGRGKLYAVKIIAGSIVTFVGNLLFIAVTVAGNFFSYGIEGFQASIQVALVNFYSYDITVGETVLILMALLLLSSIMSAIFTMVLAELLKNSVGAMAIVIGILFGARMIPMPVSWGLISQLWNYLPINLLKIDEGFIDMRLVSILGIELTTWQFAPILYVSVIIVLIWIGRRNYINYQVTGR
ncbi:MAG: hypothetical protein E7290_13745 [Lachnospiraceae bacterium]|nr:hypothetical protein [Lachnospiraceae bacterium]